MLQQRCAHPPLPTMKSGLHFLIAARQCEIDELDQLARTSELVGVIGRLVHALQREARNTLDMPRSRCSACTSRPITPTSSLVRASWSSSSISHLSLIHI